MIEILGCIVVAGLFGWWIWYGFKNSNCDPTGFWDSRSKGKGK